MNKGIMERFMERFMDKGAVPLQFAHLFLQRELKDDLDIVVKYETYQSKRMIKSHEEIGEDEYKRIKETDYTDNGKKLEQRIISNIKAYYCKRAVSNESIQKSHSSRNGTLQNGSLQGVMRLIENIY